MTYIVIELQKNAQGSVANIVTQHTTRNDAESKYHQILAAAAVSTVYQHSAVLLTDAGQEICHQSYTHPVEPEPNPEPEPTEEA